MNYIFKPAATLFLTAVVIVIALSVCFNFTKEPIERQKQKTQEAAMKQVLPSASNYIKIQTETKGSIAAVYEGLSGNILTGYVVQLSPPGYSGNIDLMVGISVSEEKITGIRVIKHTETPGLGSLAAKKDFYSRYEGKSLVPLSVVRSSPDENEIQAITSATITTKAITGAVNEAIEWFIGREK